MKTVQILRKRAFKSVHCIFVSSFIPLLTLLFCLSNFGFASEKVSSLQNQNQVFIKNQGQWDPEVQYLAKINGMNCWITSKGVVYDLYKTERSQADSQEKKILNKDPWSEMDEMNDDVVKGHVIKMEFDGRANSQRYEPQDKQETYYNYFLGNDDSKWASNVPLYKEVFAKNIYPGIDSRYYFDGFCMRYDMIVQPGADLSQIRMNYRGQDGMQINDNGELTLKTSLGDLEQKNIYAYQEMNGLKQEVKCKFQVMESGSVSFIADGYNKELPLIIDPLVYSTFIGGSGGEVGHQITADNVGNAYLTGNTTSTNYPVTSGAYQTTKRGYQDTFITKINSEGSALLYSTFIGGSDYDWGTGIDLDISGNIYLSGHTWSTNYPVTTGAFQTIHGGGPSDCFVTKLNPGGSALVYSTFIGGSGFDVSSVIIIDDMGNAYVTGSTGETDYPVTTGAFQTIYGGGPSDCFVTKLNPSGSALVFSTFIGGNNSDYGEGIAFDADENVYISGTTHSSDFPVTSGAYQTTQPGFEDCFVTKLNVSGAALVFSTYVGGPYPGGEQKVGIALDACRNVYISGTTDSPNFPVTAGAYQTTYGGGTNDCFVSKLNSTGTALIYSTFIGGSGWEYQPGSIKSNIMGDVFITGRTASSNYPVTSDAAQSAWGGKEDCFVTILKSTGALLYSTFLGGSHNDFGYGIAIDLNGNVYVTGTTGSSNFPVTSGAYQTTINVGPDSFVTKLSFEPCEYQYPVAICQDATITLNPNGSVSITSEQIDNGSYASCGIQSLSVSPNYFTCADIGTNTVILTVTDNICETATCTSIVTVIGEVQPPVAICQDISVTLNTNGNYSIVPDQVDNGSYASCGIQSMIVSPDYFTCNDIGPNAVTLTVSDNNGGISTCISTVTVIGELPEPSISVSPSPAVPGHPENTIYRGYGPQSVILTASGGTSYLWSPSTGLSCTDCIAPVATPFVTTTYTVIVTNEYGCTTTASATIFVIDVRCGNNMDKVLICHDGNTLCIASSAVQAHLNHGDFLGTCLKNGVTEEVEPEILLLKVYPNPFNKSTIIEYSIPHDATVILRVINMLGYEVSTLVNGEQKAGMHIIEFNADDRPEGIYTCLLEADGKILKRIMIRLK